MEIGLAVADAGAVAERREEVLRAVRDHAGRVARELAEAFPAFVKASDEHVGEATGVAADDL